MLESGNTEVPNADTDCVINELAHPSMMVNQLMHFLAQVEGNEIGTNSAGEVIEVNHLLSEAQTEKSLDDGSMYLNSESTEICLAVDSQTCTPEYKHQEVDHCILDSDTAQIERHESKYEFVDSMLRDADKEMNLHLQCSLSSLCHDYLSDSACDESFMLGDPSPKEPKRSDFMFQSQSIQNDGNAAGSDLSNGINPMTKSSSGQNTPILDKMDVCELQSAFRSIFGWDTCVTDIPWLKRRILFGMQNIGEVDNADNTGKNGLPSTEDEDNMILIPGNDLYERAYTFYRDVHDNRTLKVGEGLGNDGYPCKGYPKTTTKVSRVGFMVRILEEHGSAGATSKRLRKPTRRYIEEISELKPRCGSNERLETPYVGYKAKYSYDGMKGRQGLLERNLVYRDNFAASDTQVQQGLTVWRGHSGKSTSLANYESKTQSYTSEEALDDTSDDSTVIRSKRKGTRRKHHKPWVLSEVVKLVDGVSQYGVGRWTEIKRLLFSNSVHRTPVDLKDKWRNLLRAAAQANKGKVKQRKKDGKPTVPMCILWRVRQLSIIHPYPRERESRLRSTTATSSSSTDSCTGSTIQEQGFV